MARDRIKSLRRVRAGDLRPNPKNWRTHPQAQHEALRGVLAEVGYADAVLAREIGDGALMLIDGHLRADVDPDAKIPVLVLDVTEEEADKLLATLDPLAAMATVDAARLGELLGTVKTDSDALQSMLQGLIPEAAAADDGTVVQDEVPEPPTNPVAKAGDLWILGDHRILCGDSTDAKNAKRVLGGRKPFIMVTDPPYGVEYDAAWRNESGLSHSKQTGKVHNDDRASWAAAFQHFTGDVAYVWHAGRYASAVDRSLGVLGLEIRAQIVWVKKRFAIGRGNYHWRHEPCWYAVRKGATANWTGGRKQNTAWADIVDALPHDELFAIRVNEDTVYAFDGTSTTVWEIGHDAAAGGGHSTQKPVECMARPMRNHGGSGDHVYEPFLGSGTTVIAAEQLGRRCCGMELSPAYVDVVIMRWESLTGKKAKRAKTS